jgi:NAD(P)-dependent dehydrogenase (short-subunit alcohol dehydrogenase family)
MKLEGKVAVITGGARGIGLAYGRRFVEEGARIVIGDLLEEEGHAAVAELEGLGGEALYRPCDVTCKADVDALMAAAVARFGRLDCCIANAGISTQAAFLDLEEADFDRVMAVNLKGPFLTGQAAAREMVALGAGGVIINITSINAVVTNHDGTAYAASKGGVALLTKVMAISLADHGIRVNAIGPGPTRTAMEAATLADPEQRRIREIRTPLRRIAEPAEVAAVAAFLASDDASYLTGQTLYVDGGRLALAYMMPEVGAGYRGRPRVHPPGTHPSTGSG